MIYLLALHVFMSWLCAYLKTRKAKECCGQDRFQYGTLAMCLLGGWFIVPESWDNSWMDKYKNDRT